MTSIKILKAGQGDSLLIRFLGNDSKYKNILIDGGNSKKEYQNHLKKEVLQIQENNESIDLLIITHTDQDHVKGIQYLLNDEDINKKNIKQVWFNSFDSSFSSNNNDISYIESCKIQNLLLEHCIPRDNNIIVLEDLSPIDFFGAKITILSPYQSDLEKLIIQNDLDIASSGNDYALCINELIERNSNIFVDKNEDLDISLENRVSIAFLFELNNKAFLFLGDANPDIIELSIEKLNKLRGVEFIVLDFIKLSHHASQRSLSFRMLKLMTTENYTISTNRNKSNLPNKLTFAKILGNKTSGRKVNLIFNYSDDEVEENKRLNFLSSEMEDFNFECSNPNFEHGYLINYE
ncbi:MBL fold metallo-hydrolase [Chryseobacterium sp. TY4]